MRKLFTLLILSALFLVGCSGTFTKINRTQGLLRSAVLTPDGINLSVVESGNSSGPAIIFVHGFSQSSISWRRQLTSELGKTHRLIAFDLRGHGYSSKPNDPMKYVASELWANDIATVARAKGLEKFVLVGWSYGGLSLLDYVQKHGQEKLTALIFVATSYNLDLRPPEAGGPEPVLGPGVIENTGPMAGIPLGPPGADLDGCAAVKKCGEYARQLNGTKRFLKMVPGSPLPTDLADEALAYNLQTPPHVRRAMVVDRFVKGGPLDHSPTLSSLKVPVLFMHGTKDQHVLPRSTEIMQKLVDANGGSTERILYEGLGHAVFIENPKQFNADLLEFISNL